MVNVSWLSHPLSRINITVRGLFLKPNKIQSPLNNITWYTMRLSPKYQNTVAEQHFTSLLLEPYSQKDKKFWIACHEGSLQPKIYGFFFLTLRKWLHLSCHSGQFDDFVIALPIPTVMSFLISYQKLIIKIQNNNLF